MGGVLLCVFSPRWRRPLCAALAPVLKQFNFNQNRSKKHLSEMAIQGLFSGKSADQILAAGDAPTTKHSKHYAANFRFT
jgi:hypothetical protein